MFIPVNECFRHEWFFAHVFYVHWEIKLLKKCQRVWISSLRLLWLHILCHQEQLAKFQFNSKFAQRTCPLRVFRWDCSIFILSVTLFQYDYLIVPLIVFCYRIHNIRSIQFLMGNRNVSIEEFSHKRYASTPNDINKRHCSFLASNFLSINTISK